MDPRVYRCARTGDIRSLKRLLDESPSTLMKLTPQENTALHIAASFGHVSVVKEVYGRCKSLLTKPNLDGDIPLHGAARAGHLGVVEFLVTEILKTDVESEDSDKYEMLRWRNMLHNTALHEAIKNGRLEVAKLLIKVDPQLVCHENTEAETPLFLAAARGMIKLVNQIVLLPSPAEGRFNGKTSLHIAVIERHPDVVESLARAKPHLINVADHDGRTPLHYAAFLGDHKMVRKLLEFNCSAAYVLDKNGHSPLHAASLVGHPKVIEEIIRHCPDSGELLDLNGQTALHLAVIGGKANAVSCILEAADLEGLINQSDKNGNTPLHVAKIEGKTWIARHLLWDERVDQKARNRSGKTALEISMSSKEYRRIPLTTVSSIHRDLQDSFPGVIQEEDSTLELTYKQRGQTLLMVATLITTVTFAAAFTMPGGYNNEVGPEQGEALLKSSIYLEQFVISDIVAMICSITAACIIIWGTVVGKRSYVFCYVCAATLTYIALLLTIMACTTGLKAVLPSHAYVNSVNAAVSCVSTIITSLFLVGLAQTFSIPEVGLFLASCLRKNLKKRRH